MLKKNIIQIISPARLHFGFLEINSNQGDNLLGGIGLSIDKFHTKISMKRNAKIKVKGNFNRSDERLKELYYMAREIAKRNNCLVWAVSQAGADAEGGQHTAGPRGYRSRDSDIIR